MKKLTKEALAKSYAKLYKSLKRRPTRSDLQKAGYSREVIRQRFDTQAKLDSEARKLFPTCFPDVPLSSLIQKRSTTQDQISRHNKFVITTAVAGCFVDEKFYLHLKKYCEEHAALLIILVASDPAHDTSNDGYGFIDARLEEELVLLEDARINSNLFISTIKLSAKHIDPTTGLGRIGQRNGSFIFASPKQRLQLVATSNTKMPHALMTTGAITSPDYSTNRPMSERTAYIANHDHVMGAVVVEKVDDKLFHYRQIQKGKDGSFHDLDNKGDVDTIVLGDLHAGETDDAVIWATQEMIETLNPKRIVIHDGFDGRSISHHEKDRTILKAQRFAAGDLNLRNEVEYFANVLEAFRMCVPEVVVVKSNHDEFLARYLQEGYYVKDPQNMEYALELASAMLKGHDPLKYGVEKHHIKEHGHALPNLKFLTVDEDYRVKGIQLGAHGHLGSNGSRGSLRSAESAYGSCVIGHTHTPGILRGAYNVGTSTPLKVGYNSGPSSWLQAHCIIHKDGSRQLINIIDGKWRADGSVTRSQQGKQHVKK